MDFVASVSLSRALTATVLPALSSSESLTSPAFCALAVAAFMSSETRPFFCTSSLMKSLGSPSPTQPVIFFADESLRAVFALAAASVSLVKSPFGQMLVIFFDTTPEMFPAASRPRKYTVPFSFRTTPVVE